LTTPNPPELLIYDVDRRRSARVSAAMGEAAVVVADPEKLYDAEALLVATSAGRHADVARRGLDAGTHVVSISDAVEDVRSLLRLDDVARAAGRSVVVGAGYSPGFSCVLARHGSSLFDRVDEIHVARTGTAGWACARQHHRTLAGDSVDWWAGAWRDRPGRSGRALVWFPEPVGGHDCYRAALADPYLLAPVFPDVERVTARVAATRRDRLTARLPMLRRPHDDGGIGGIHVEIRGRRAGVTDSAVLGAADQVSVGAATVAAVAVLWALSGLIAPGARGVGAIDDSTGFLAELARRGVRAAMFEGWAG
jgi:hypothetical protein